MSRFRFLILTVEALRPGAFEWALQESFDDVSGFKPCARSDRTFSTYESAWEAGCAALDADMNEPHPHLLDETD